MSADLGISVDRAVARQVAEEEEFASQWAPEVRKLLGVVLGRHVRRLVGEEKLDDRQLLELRGRMKGAVDFAGRLDVRLKAARSGELVEEEA